MKRFQLVTLLFTALSFAQAGLAANILDNTKTTVVGSPKLEKRLLVNLKLTSKDPDHDIVAYGEDLEVDNTDGLVIDIGDSKYDVEEGSYAKTEVSALQFDEKVQRYLVRQFNSDKPDTKKWFVVQEIVVNVDRKAMKARVWARTIENETDKKKRKLGSWYEVADFGK